VVVGEDHKALQERMGGSYTAPRGYMKCRSGHTIEPSNYGRRASMISDSSFSFGTAPALELPPPKVSSPVPSYTVGAAPLAGCDEETAGSKISNEVS
jgi:hypothetical protein